MATQKLNQVLAVESEVKGRTHNAITALHQAAQKPALFNGFSKTYQPMSEDGQALPPERQKVQMKVEDVLGQAASNWTDLFDVTAAKDFANCDARGDVVIDGVTVVANAPATYLLFLEKQLTDVKTFITKLPVLDEADDWRKDSDSGLHRTDVVKTHRTQKVNKPIVLYPATPEHPAQTQMATEDVLVGHWLTTKMSGAITATQQKEILSRTEKLIRAVKYARESANMTVAAERTIGKPVFDYLFAR